jgi:rRNA 2'-O-methyltransferase fibrillarin
MPAGKVYDGEVDRLRADLLKPAEMVTLDRFERDHARVIGSYRVPKKQKIAA